MAKDTIYIYINPDADLDLYPDHLLGDMSIFRSARTIRHEVQWVFYLMLKDQGLDVQICRDYPDEGILIIHKANARKFTWKPNLFVVSLQWDYKRDDRGQIHLVSNHYKTLNSSLGWLDRLSFPGLQYYVPPVMHSVVVPRDADRGERFEHVAFIGDPKNLDDAFRTEEFSQKLQELGMRLSIITDPQMLPDYSDVDVLIAIRELGRVITNKPPVKLINAWRGGVPAILGCEIGYREARESDNDFIEVDSVEETLTALKRLKEDIDYRNGFLANAKERALPFSAEGQQKYWLEFIRNVVLPANDAWQRRSIISRACFLVVRWIRAVLRYTFSFVRHSILGRGYNDYS